MLLKEEPTLDPSSNPSRPRVRFTNLAAPIISHDTILLTRDLLLTVISTHTNTHSTSQSLNSAILMQDKSKILDTNKSLHSNIFIMLYELKTQTQTFWKFKNEFLIEGLKLNLAKIRFGAEEIPRSRSEELTRFYVEFLSDDCQFKSFEFDLR